MPNEKEREMIDFDEVALLYTVIEQGQQHGAVGQRIGTEARKRLQEICDEIEVPGEPLRRTRAITPPEGPANAALQLQPGDEPVRVRPAPQPGVPLGRRDEITGEPVLGGTSQTRSVDEIEEARRQREEDLFDPQREQRKLSDEELEAYRRKQAELAQAQVREGDPRGRPDPTPGQPVPSLMDRPAGDVDPAPVSVDRRV